MASDDNDDSSAAWMLVRIFQVLTLIPCWALLAAVISKYNSNNQLSPPSIQFLFSIALILSVWSFCLIITYLRARNTALWMAFFDIVGMTCLIAGVVWLSNIANVECLVVTVVTWSSSYNFTTNNAPNDPYSLDPSKKFSPRMLVRRAATDLNAKANFLVKRQTYVDANGNVVTRPLYTTQCGAIKAAWGLAIANIILFFISAILSAIIYRDNMYRRPVVREKIVVESSGPSHAGVGVAHPAPVHTTGESVFGGSTYGGSRRHSRRGSQGGRSARRYQHRRSSRVASSDYYA